MAATTTSDLTEQLLDEEEGPPSATVYADSRGFSTIARGVCIDPRVPGAGLPAAAIAIANEAKVADATLLAQHFPRWSEHIPIRQAVLISMCFQMGEGPLHWPNFNKALAQLDYNAAADAGLDSTWARIETPRRAERQMKMLRSGLWVAREP
jgi:GH24 family phage-related lysozyme (muramidase)